MIDINNVGKSFNNKSVLKSINLHIQEGEIFGIVGHSGAGKSTLLRCLNGLESYDAGSIKVMGKEVKDLKGKEIRTFRKNLGMIFQNFNLLNRKNVYDNISLPLEVWGLEKSKIKTRVKELLNLVGLSDKAKSMPSELSGGQKQRVAIARALALNPSILLCDEATSALDPNTTKSILELLRKINNEFKITIVVVTHQMEVIKEICSKIAIIDEGEIKTSGNVEEIFLKPGKNLKKLLGNDSLLPDEGINIRIFFPKEISQDNLITSMAIDLNIKFSIVWGKLERFRSDVLGSLVINVNDKDKESICNYLSSKNVNWEVE
ncbi:MULTISPECIES: methionine ABC transporter ATP-binding protein [Clostridium]|uniref:Methionine import ATP-binding protein MetN n=3 Tax=Clostridium TaxID=1485 RepID=D8GMD2_CLOLD|nr:MULTISPECIES: methionine ABC transporter ATP-binding protein [Clostridium]ADK13542.1 predicted ABC transporter, ATPase component [Clostridium ljungdahlii DSM 13528]AGY76741.1 methionine ABC transporter ATP-binding protein [Clostridium autoethanogenum DSM 10061]ALU36895.1 Methionine import ATP-binding protein MetN [Clostridium autoethanogenum DSM 10061]OAA89160.1 Methionine import ATP-binding protein MetN [Clostridium ljungdahlii DSM 13528]OAA94232.1 Methionine import ATP-binding protein Met